MGDRDKMPIEKEIEELQGEEAENAEDDAGGMLASTADAFFSQGHWKVLCSEGAGPADRAAKQR